MRIGILTFHKAINYGAYLQSFSLSEKLRECFPKDEVEIIDYIAPKERNRKIYILLRNIKHDGIKGGISELKRIRAFNSMRKNLPLSPKSFCKEDLNEVYAYINERYDMMIIGSDAVFNWNQTNFPTAFIPDYKFDIPVYSYAASVHGLNFYDEPQERLKKCGEVFGNMKCVGVRDLCTENFVKHCSKNAEVMHCCDPTVFINTDKIYQNGMAVEKKVQKRYKFSLDEKYIAVMAPDSAMVKSIAEKYGNEYKIVSVFVKSSYADVYVADLNPFEWSVILKKAAVTVTSYFHGTLLSLVQGTPTIVLDYSGYCDERYEGKLKDLLVTRLSLPELYFDKNYAAEFDGSSAFYKKFEELLCGKYKEKIETAMAAERKSFDAFLEKITP